MLGAQQKHDVELFYELCYVQLCIRLSLLWFLLCRARLVQVGSCRQRFGQLKTLNHHRRPDQEISCSAEPISARREQKQEHTEGSSHFSQFLPTLISLRRHGHLELDVTKPSPVVSEGTVKTANTAAQPCEQNSESKTTFTRRRNSKNKSHPLWAEGWQGALLEGCRPCPDAAEATCSVVSWARRPSCCCCLLASSLCSEGPSQTRLPHRSSCPERGEKSAHVSLILQALPSS